MKVLLVRHPTTHAPGTAAHISGIPLGLLYVAAAVRAAGHHVEVYDAAVEGARRVRTDEYRDGRYRLGATWDEIRSAVRRVRPDVVGIGSQYSSQVQNAIATAEVVKSAGENIIVVVGGANATVMPEALLDGCRAIDYVVVGEGEVTTVELLGCLAAGGDPRTVQGVACRDGGEAVTGVRRPLLADLDSLPLPAYDLIDLERYFAFNATGMDGRDTHTYLGSERSVSMVTSRGCPYSCVFCSIHLSMGRKFRAHSPAYVLNHLEHLAKTYAVRHVHFEDDNLTFDMPRFSAILDALKLKEFGFTWDTPNGVRADYLDADILTKCRDTGCTYLRIGVESANTEVSRTIVRKALDLNNVLEVSRLCKDIGIDLEAFYIIGFPGETVEQMKETVEFAVSAERKYGLYPFDMFTAIPLVGTELHRTWLARGYPMQEDGLQLRVQPARPAPPGQAEAYPSDSIEALLADYRRKHRRARVLYSLKFILRHPKYIAVRLGDGAYARRLARALASGRLAEALNSLLFYRYKNCVLRNVGAAPIGAPWAPQRAS